MLEEGFTPTTNPEIVARIEAHCVIAWPAATTEMAEDGWILRALPGLDRGRSNHALTPPWSIDPAGFEPALAHVADFAERHEIPCGIQVSPIDAHIQLLDFLATSGWEIQDSVLVLSLDTAVAAGIETPDLDVVVEDHAGPEWLAAWGRCEPERVGPAPGRDIQTHAETVFPLMAGKAKFVRHGEKAVAIAVDHEGVVGLFCIAVAPESRRQGLGKALVRGILADCDGPLTYLQVFGHNVAGIALYQSLGFEEAYRYCHCIAPAVTA